jgi:predicted DNA-binding transcriptional regulator AlpA
VRRDIAAGILAVMHDPEDGCAYVSARSLRAYRSSKHSPEDLWSVCRAAAELGIHPASVYRAIRQGRVPAEKIGGKTYILANQPSRTILRLENGTAVWVSASLRDHIQNRLSRDQFEEFLWAEQVRAIVEWLVEEPLVSVADLAALSGRSRREVYHHKNKGALVGWTRLPNSSRRLGVRLSDARAYLREHDRVFTERLLPAAVTLAIDVWHRGNTLRARAMRSNEASRRRLAALVMRELLRKLGIDSKSECDKP